MSILLHPRASVPLDPTTKMPIERAQDRVQALLEKLQRERTKIVLPWPGVAEFMIFARPDHIIYLDAFKSAATFELSEFDYMASIELTEIAAKDPKPSKSQRKGDTWVKVKYDRQIIAIAIAKGCKQIYSTDNGLRAHAKRLGLEAFTIADLPDPPAKQEVLFEMGKVVGIDEGVSSVQA